MKFKSALVTQISGSIGGMTGSHNQGGLYLRARSIPTNPQTAPQTVVRNAMALLSARWSNTVTAEQRSGWRTYAMAVPITDRLGEPRIISGNAWYQACNVPRIQVGLDIVDDPPLVYTMAELTAPSVDAWDVPNDTADITFDPDDGWATAEGGALAIYASRPQSAAIEYFKGPYQLAGTVAGAVVPPTSPATIGLPFPVAAGQQVFFQARALQADGRISSAIRFRGEVA